MNSLSDLAAALRLSRGMAHKLDIQGVGRAMASCGTAADIPIGDDCAAIPDGSGYLLFAIEGLLNEFVSAEPWFAGYCGVMVNVSDVYAMGGRPTAVVDALWSRGDERGGRIWEGMLAASRAYGVPIVGGHTNHKSDREQLSVAIVGRARKLLTSFHAVSGDVLIAAIDLRGTYFDAYPYWNASTTADSERLQGDLEILPTLAEDGLCAAAKDISMGGIIGTALMLCECSGVGCRLDVLAVPRPPGEPLEKWLVTFPSYGFLLSVSPTNASKVLRRFADRGIAAATVGSCDPSREIRLRDNSQEALFWDLSREPFIGFLHASKSSSSVPEPAGHA